MSGEEGGGKSLIERDGGVLTLRLPGGALTADTARRLVTAIEDDILDDDTVRVVLLGAAGADFCAGLDPSIVDIRHRLDPAAAVAAIGVPVVVWLTGAVVSGGLELAMAGDIRVAAPGCTFALDDLAGGALPCWGGTQRLTRLVGITRASGMILLGDRMDAPTAVRAGLLTRVTDDPAAAAAELAARIAELAPIATRYAKEAVTSGAALDMPHAMQVEADLNALLQTTADRAEGVDAFLAHRVPSFRGD